MTILYNVLPTAAVCSVLIVSREMYFEAENGVTYLKSRFPPLKISFERMRENYRIRQTDRERQKDQTDRQTDSQIDRQTDRQKGRQTARQTAR